MDPNILTPRLKLTLVTKVERGSQEFEWFHALLSNEKATWWSIRGQAKSIEDTERGIERCVPANEGEAEKKENIYRVVYVVHKILEPMSRSVDDEPQPAEQEKEKPTEFIGIVTLRSLDAGNLALPEHLTIPVAAAATTLTVELGYMFLPIGWGKGYATESVEAVLKACQRAPSFWAPFPKLYVRAIVNQGNPASLRVMDKIGIPKRGIYDWTGRIFLAGEWRERDQLHIYGKHLLE